MEETLKQAFALLLASGGPWFAALAIAMFVVWKLFDLLLKEKDGRREDANTDRVEAIKALNENARALERLTDVLNAGRRRT